MTEHKFTDDEIIKALRCLSGEEIPCLECAFVTHGHGFACKKNVSTAALSLINRQKTEIEKMQKVVNADVLLVHRRCGKSEQAKQIIRIKTELVRAEAIKEFAERVEVLVQKRAEEAKALRDSETRNPIVEERYNGEYLGALIVLSDIAKLKKEYEEQTNDLI